MFKMSTCSFDARRESLHSVVLVLAHYSLLKLFITILFCTQTNC